MAKTKAELLNEYRDLKKENLKLNNQLEHWKAIARKENDRVVDLAQKLDESEKEKTLVRAQRDNLLLEHEKNIQEISEIQNDLEILQSEVRKIQFDEGVIHDQSYEEGYRDARHSYEKAVAARDSEIDRLIDDNDLLHWVLYQIHENNTK